MVPWPVGLFVGRVGDDAGGLVKRRAGHPIPDGVERDVVGPGHQQAVSSPDDLRGDPGGLLRRFPLAEHDLRKALPNGPVVVDPREPDVLERCLTHRGGQLRVGRLDLEHAVTYLLEQGAERFGSHAGAVCHRRTGDTACRVDFVGSVYLIYLTHAVCRMDVFGLASAGDSSGAVPRITQTRVGAPSRGCYSYSPAARGLATCSGDRATHFRSCDVASEDV